jgi:large subunit ribosomal protein L15
VKLHDLHPTAGARRARTRVGRGIAAGQGKTAGRGTKGQRSRTGASIPAWFEGGQTPIHIRVPKLHGFKNKFKVHYEVVNVGQIAAYAEAGRLGTSSPPTVNAETLAQAGLIRGDGKPLKVLGEGEVGVKLFVAADAFSASARAKIEAAGGFVQLLAPEAPAAAEAEAEARESKNRKAKPAKTQADKTESKAAKAEPAPRAESESEQAATGAESDSEPAESESVPGESKSKPAESES